MTKEKMYYITYRVCDFVRSREMQNQFEDYEFCMYVGEMVEIIDYAIESKNYDILNPYYNVLNEELEEFDGLPDLYEYCEGIKELIDLLDECKDECLQKQ